MHSQDFRWGGALFFFEKGDDLFLVEVLKTRAKTTELTAPTLRIFSNTKTALKCNFLPPWGVLTCLGHLQLSPINYTKLKFLLRPGGASPGYVYDYEPGESQESSVLPLNFFCDWDSQLWDSRSAPVDNISMVGSDVWHEKIDWDIPPIPPLMFIGGQKVRNLVSIFDPSQQSCAFVTLWLRYRATVRKKH